MAQDHASTARQTYEDWNAREFDRIAEQMADGGEILDVGSGTRFSGPEGSKRYSKMWADAFPDGRIQIDNVISSGDTVVVELTGRGTQTGTLKTPAGEIPATGSTVTLQLCDVLEFTSDGKIKAQRSYFDSASLLAQLGVKPEAGVTTKI
jgi:predicted ester cyclase